MHPGARLMPTPCKPWVRLLRRRFHSGMHFTLQISLLVNTFVDEMGAELIELDITSCWGQLLEEVLLQR